VMEFAELQSDARLDREGDPEPLTAQEVAQRLADFRQRHPTK